MRDRAWVIPLDPAEAAVISDALRMYARTHIGPVVSICEDLLRDLEDSL
jgi:hypothetical protein